RLGMSDAQADSQALLFVAGIWHGLSYVHLWLVQTLTAGAPSSLLALMAWLLLLVQGACFVWPLLLWLQGLSLLSGLAFKSALVDPRPAQIMRSAVSPWLALMLMLLVGWSLLAPRPWSWITGQPQLVQLGGTYYAVPEDRLARILRENADWLNEDVALRFVAMQQLADARLDSLFADARSRVPDYASWHYSFSGGMTRSAVAMM